ncbi:MAG: prepilin peptidase [Hyphomonadaceae bacterium]|nr:prepilin peptidase [Hyphomonadaceae bacterium]
MMSVIWIVFAGLFAAAAFIDGRTYRIPNWIPIALAVLFAIAAFASGEPVVDYWQNGALAVGVLAIGYLLYALTGMGAGDAKLGAVAVLWAGLSGLYAWTFWLAVAMGVLAFGLIAARRLAKMATADGLPRQRILQRGAPVPLGIALAAAAILASWKFDPSIWAF